MSFVCCSISECYKPVRYYHWKGILLTVNSLCPLLVLQFLKVIVKEVVSKDMSLFPNEDILTKEIESWKSFGDSLSSKEDRELFEKMLNDCYKYAAAINAKGQPFPTELLIMALLLSQHKMIDWLSKQISKYESLDNNKVIKKSEEELGRENTHDYIRKNDGRIHYIDDY
jgi:hypothetical protein